MKAEEKSNKKNNTNKIAKKTVNSVKKKPKKNKKNVKLRRYIFIIIGLSIILSTITILILFSNLFNIKQIKVENNLKVSTVEIIEKSGLTVGNNMFKKLSRNIRKGIKENPYIENVIISKKLNGEVIIKVKERTPTYMLQNEAGYTYINNQGYILETSQTPLALPILKGASTQEYIPGNRIIVEDLKKLDTVIQIMDSAQSNGIREKISAIDISDEKNFILEIPTENKTVQFGDSSSINVKILWIVDLIKREEGKTGEIILNVKNIKKVYFREAV